MFRLSKTRIITFFFLFAVFNNSQALSKSTNFTYTEKNISSYLSGIISMNKNNTNEANNFFKKIKPPPDEHKNFKIQFLRTLVLLGKFEKSFTYAKNLEEENANFDEANIILGINYFINNDYNLSEKYFEKLNEDLENNFYLERYFSDFLIAIIRAAQNDEMQSFKRLELIPKSLISLKKVESALLHCYFDSKKTHKYFYELVNDKDKSFSRYDFFLANHLIHNDKIEEAKKLISASKKRYEGNILIHQTYDYLSSEKYKKIKNFFNCKNPLDIMSEFFYIIANLYSAEKNYLLSNFYLKISLFLNKKFESNQNLLAENYFYQENYDSAKKIYFSLKKIGSTYSWHAIKYISYIISLTEGEEKAVDYLKSEVKKIPNLNYYNYYDLANSFESNNDLEEAIKYYTKALIKLEVNHYLIPIILYKRGTSYERLGMWSEAEKDLKQSLKLLPDQPYVLNYLAYSWLDRKKNINESLEMLKKANELKQSDGYITDSLGWGFYLIDEYSEAEKFLRKAVELMPFDPIINDHYGDVLWKLNKTIQARYFWKHAISFEKEDKEFIETVNQKLIFGLEDKS